MRWLRKKPGVYDVFTHSIAVCDRTRETP